jgi:hypothetical protein
MSKTQPKAGEEACIMEEFTIPGFGAVVDVD